MPTIAPVSTTALALVAVELVIAGCAEQELPYVEPKTDAEAIQSWLVAEIKEMWDSDTLSSLDREDFYAC